MSQLGANLSQLRDPKSIKRNKKVQIANGPIKQMLFSIFSRFWVFQNDQFWIKNRGNLAFWRPWEVCSGDFLGFWANIDASWGQLGPTWANMSQLDPTWSNISQHKASISQHKANISQHKANISQHKFQKITGTHLRGGQIPSGLFATLSGPLP